MKITEFVVGSDGLKPQQYPNGTYYWLQTDYERIEERGWGRLHRDSPVPGLCTDLIETCLVFVFHCGTTGKTTLCHAVSGTDLAVFDAQIRYVSNDTDSQVELVVLKGRAYGDPGDLPPHIFEEDLAWVSQTLDRIRVRRPTCNASLHSEPTGYGVVLVQKASGDIIIPVPPRYLPAVTKFLHCTSSVLVPEALAKRELLDAFYVTQSAASFVASGFTTVPCFEVYDGTRRLNLPPTSDDTREIFRIVNMHPKFPALAPIRQSDWDIYKRVAPNKEMYCYVQKLCAWMPSAGAPWCLLL
ncbi:hypothetical protein DFH06DRAFT_1479608 [Mycena polygramma]|nr:hypothetical protein DFH06DRAFT_1479608 [Mycena polygramma]